MRKSWIRLLALLICLAALSGLLPAAAAGSFGDRYGKTTVWDRISAFETEYVRAKRLPGGELSYEDYCAIAGEIASIVTSAPDVVEGSCTYDPESGNATFFWDGTDGNAYGYSPSLAARMNGRTITDPEAVDVSERISYAEKGTASGQDVYVIGPWYGSDSSFTDQYKNEAQSVAQATGGTCTVYATSQATVANVAKAIQNGAVVFFDSHGVTDYDQLMSYKDDGYDVYDSVTKANTSYLTLTTDAGWTNDDKATVTGSFGTYKHAWSFLSTDGSWCHCVDGTAIANHMTSDANGGLIWMALCLGMATDGLCAPLRAKGAGVVYGYSQSVSFDYDYEWEEVFWKELKEGQTVSTAFSAMTEEIGQWDYCDWPEYDTVGEARYYMCAFPNVVSDDDVYQGQRNKNPASASAANQTAYDADYGACNIQTVSSGWSLFGNYTVTATVNDPSFGSVSVTGTVIKATPAEGYYVSGANVLSGTADVTVDGNTVYVRPSSDCTVEVVFSAKVPVTLTFLANGAPAGTLDGMTGDPVILPDTAPDIGEWVFAGWSTEAVAETEEEPDFYAPGASFVPSGDTTFYAVYVKSAPGAGPGDWTLLEDEADLQPGLQIVFACNTNDAVAGGLNNTYLSSVECKTFDGDTITSLPESAAVFTVGGRSGEWTFATEDGNLCCSEVKKLNFSGNGTDTWSVSVSDGIATVENGTSSNGTLLYNRNSPRFTTYTTNQTEIQIYFLDGSAPVFTYTTHVVVCEHHSLTATAAAEPTCGKDGNIAYWTCDDCGAVFSDADASVRISLADTVLPATGEHTYGAYASNGNGTHSRTCSVCAHVETEDCTYDDVVTPPTADEQGYTTHTCSLCAYSFADTYTEPLGPTYTVTFTVPDGSGVTPPAAMGCNRLGIQLPSADGFTFDGVDYTFAGWVTEEQDHVGQKPDNVLSGMYVATGDVTLKALYAYASGEGGGGQNPSLETVDSLQGISDGDEIVITAYDTGLGLYQETSGTTYVKNFAFDASTAPASIADDPKTHLTFHAGADGWIIGNDTDGYLYSSGSNNLALDPANKTAFTLSSAEDGFTLKTAGGRYLSCRTDLTSSNANLWRLGGTNAKTGTSTLVLYKFVPAGGQTAAVSYTTIVVPPCAHTDAEFVPAVPPTCVAAGNSAYYHCPDCGKYFSDEACETEISLEETVIPATGVHTYGEPEWVWAEGHVSAQAVFTCPNCGDTVRADASVTVTEDKGVRYYTASAEFGGRTYTSDPNGQKEFIDYTVTFFDWDGTVISEQTLHYGDSAVLPDEPSKASDETYAYTFAGWDPEVVSVTGDATYTASYTQTYIEYTVTFNDWDGTVLSERDFHYGDAVIPPSDPFRAEDDDYTYTFAGWDPAISTVTGPATYTAVYEAQRKPLVAEFGLETVNGGRNGETTILIPSDGEDTLSEISATTAAPDYLPGDVNGDGDIDGRDYIVVKKFVLGTVDFTERQQQIGDINGDGEVDGIDYLLIKKHVLGTYTIPEPQPVEVPGPDYADCAVIVVNANGKVQSVKQADGKSKADLSVPAGGYAIAVPKTVLESNPALLEAVGTLTAETDLVELLNVSLNELEGASGTALSNAFVRITVNK